MSGPRFSRYVVFPEAAAIAAWFACKPRFTATARFVPDTSSVSEPISEARPAVACKLVNFRAGSARSAIIANAKFTWPSDNPA